jgi:hypothetical protein
MNQDRMKTPSDRRRTDMEPAEGSQENVTGGGSSSSERGLDEGMQGGIADHDLDREEFEQDELPERGRSTDSDR